MMKGINPYTYGFQAATQEVFAVLQDQDHPNHNPYCEACRTMEHIANHLLVALSAKMTREELYGVAMAIYGLNNSPPAPEEDLPFLRVRLTNESS